MHCSTMSPGFMLFPSTPIVRFDDASTTRLPGRNVGQKSNHNKTQVPEIELDDVDLKLR